MCGFLGVGGKSFYENKIEEINCAFNWLHHRGPDESNTRLIGDFFIGFHRLSVVGIKNKEASQPIVTPNKKLSMMFNGEIYNYLQLRKELSSKGIQFRSNTDSEVVLYAVAHWGKEALLKLNGMFAFALWDRKSN